jgi:hypothetical protein
MYQASFFMLSSLSETARTTRAQKGCPSSFESFNKVRLNLSDKW